MPYYGMQPNDAYNMAPTRFGGVSTYLNLKKQFMDAVRQNEWKTHQDYLNSQADLNKQKISTAGQLASGGMMTPEQFKSNTAYNDPYTGQQVPGMDISTPSGSSDLVYRDSMTGEEVPAEIAVPTIQAGDQKYNVYKNVHTRGGLRETPITAPPKLTQDERTYLVATKRMGTRLNSILDTIDNNFKSVDGNKAKWGLYQAVQADKVPYLFIGNREVQRFKNDLNSLKADIPFLRGGKQLTPTEAKRVDILLSPVGKLPDEYRRDMEIFQQEFLSGQQVMKYGVRGLEGEPFKQNNNSGVTSSGLRYTIEP